jgi:hypothetical protein
MHVDILAQLTFLLLRISVSTLRTGPLPISRSSLTYAHVFATLPSQRLYFQRNQTFYVYQTAEIVHARLPPPFPLPLADNCQHNNPKPEASYDLDYD